MAIPPIANLDTLNEIGAISRNAISARIKFAPQKKVKRRRSPWWDNSLAGLAAVFLGLSEMIKRIR